MRPHPGTDGGLPASLPMGTADVAYHLAMGGRPLPTGLVFGFSGRAPALDAVRARVAERAHRIPALRYRIARDRTAFSRVDRIAVEHHVHEAWLPGDDDGSGAGRLMLSRPMGGDDRPPWDVWLVHGPTGGHSLCYRTDHTFQDGVGAAHTARALLDDDPRGGPAPHRRAWPTARGLAGALGDVAASLRPSAKPAFDLPGSGRTGMCQAVVPLARVRAVGRAHGATVNDVFLAALAHATGTWHAKNTGSPHPPLPVAVPMSVRGPGEECAPGNRIVVARVLLPCDAPSPHHALERIKERTTVLRTSRQRDALRLLLTAGPRTVGARVGTRMVHGRTVAGPASSVNFGAALVHQGSTARRAVVYSGLGAGIRCVTTLTSQHDTACLALMYDEALSTADELPDLWLAGLLELERS
ncbi:condensation protein [Streptomyces viridiviolaceus]|uniref:Wax ester/triacylglycerol synthase domain-containing protein n=1 Tax=Streptomyces viridiviolaceus TaxID=68282 RepID=A0ABW2DWP9_9ACTN|nr:wax ester/triacylglycerol synthase domain-containing protein [Streptomyces viridiviolaceus]GHB27289.1 condensation protein [Streptomyces viridiviolaceus]